MLSPPTRMPVRYCRSPSPKNSRRARPRSSSSTCGLRCFFLNAFDFVQQLSDLFRSSKRNSILFRNFLTLDFELCDQFSRPPFRYDNLLLNLLHGVAQFGQVFFAKSDLVFQQRNLAEQFRVQIVGPHLGGVIDNDEKQNDCAKAARHTVQKRHTESVSRRGLSSPSVLLHRNQHELGARVTNADMVADEKLPYVPESWPR